MSSCSLERSAVSCHGHGCGHLRVSSLLERLAISPSHSELPGMSWRRYRMMTTIPAGCLEEVAGILEKWRVARFRLPQNYREEDWALRIGQKPERSWSIELGRAQR